MDPKLLIVFQEQVGYACKAVVFGVRDVQTGVNTLSDPDLSGESDDLVWYGVQNLVVGAGNLSKILWGTGRNPKEREERAASRKPLRDSLSVANDSPFREVRIRNDYEHIDERVEVWWEETDRNRIGAVICRRESLGGSILDSGKSIFRWLDPAAGDIIFWGSELNIPTVEAEAVRILNVVEARQAEYYGGGGSSTSTRDDSMESSVES